MATRNGVGELCILLKRLDEAQLEVSRKDIKFKMFATEEEAQTFKDGEIRLWSDTKPSIQGNFFVAYCKAGELAAESVKEAGEYFKLEVELTAGYIINKDWAGCH